MEELKERIADLAIITIAEQAYLSYQAVTDAVAAFLFPGTPAGQIDETQYRRILETADTVCHNLGYTDVTRLTPPQVPFVAMGLYSRKPIDAPEAGKDHEIIVGPAGSRSFKPAA